MSTIHGLLAHVTLTMAVGLVACRDPLEPVSSYTPVAAKAGSPAAGMIPDRYIVILRDGVSNVKERAERQVSAAHGTLHLTYQHALRGYSATLSPAAVEALRREPTVESIEPDSVILRPNVRPARTPAPGFSALSGPVPALTLLDALGNATQSPTPSWGLDRIDQRDRPLSGSYTPSSGSHGVHIYILDSPIRRSHQDFGGRVEGRFDGDGCGDEPPPESGHGTAVAAVAAGTTFGVRKGGTIVDVSVLDCDTSSIIAISTVLAGIDWVTANAIAPAVANISWTAGNRNSVAKAVTNSINAGVIYVAQAGPGDACLSSPGRLPAVITVASSTVADANGSSGFGSCIDLYAPGEGITTAWDDMTNGTTTTNGMHVPHVTGAAALYLEQHPASSQAQVAQALISNASLNRISNPGPGTPNRLLYTGFLNRDHWEPRAPLPRPRRDLALGVVSGVIYAIGGVGGSGTVARVEAYDPATGKWSTKAPLPSARQSANGTALVGGLLYAPGGYNASDVLTKSLYAYNPATNTWVTQASLPVTSGCGATRSIGGKLYVLTGCSGSTNSAVGLLHRYDPSANSWSTRRTAPNAHRYPAAGVIGGKLYVVGGGTRDRNASGKLDVYDPGTNTWTTKASMPRARRGAAGAVIDGKLYVVGGVNGAGGYLSNVEIYTPATNSWATAANLPVGRAGLTAVASGGLLFAVGGRNSTTLVATHESYRP